MMTSRPRKGGLPSRGLYLIRMFVGGLSTAAIDLCSTHSCTAGMIAWPSHWSAPAQ